MSKIRNRQNGFTIIEIMIVLAIAGFILLLVFLTVTMLQRTARNTERKHDVAALAATIITYSQNNVGQAVNNIKNDNGDPNLVDISSLGNHNNLEVAHLGFYNSVGAADNTWGPAADHVFVNVSGPVNVLKTPNVAPPGATGINGNRISVGEVSIQAGETCNDAGDAAGQLDTGSVAIFYVLEGGIGNGSLHCLTAQ